jgi:hypothetical protein
MNPNYINYCYEKWLEPLLLFRVRRLRSSHFIIIIYSGSSHIIIIIIKSGSIMNAKRPKAKEKLYLLVRLKLCFLFNRESYFTLHHQCFDHHQLILALSFTSQYLSCIFAPISAKNSVSIVAIFLPL